MNVKIKVLSAQILLYKQVRLETSVCKQPVKLYLVSGNGLHFLVKIMKIKLNLNSELTGWLLRLLGTRGLLFFVF